MAKVFNKIKIYKFKFLKTIIHKLQKYLCIYKVWSLDT